MRTWRLWAMTVCVLASGVGVAGQGGVILSRPGQVPGAGVTGPRDSVKPKTGTACLRGRVIGGDSGAPLRRAIVQLSGENLQEGRSASTDEEGRWELKDLPAGRYSLGAFKAGYVHQQYGQRRLSDHGRPIEIAEAQTLENLNFNLSRGSVIAGRVTDEFGDPIADVMVTPLRYHYFNGRRRLMPVGRFDQTDDGGNFRLYGLPPGDYYVSATPDGSSMGMGAVSADRLGYSTTYYPGTGSAQQAEKVTVGLGTEMSGLAFSLLEVRTATVSGVVLNSLGKPITGGFVAANASGGEDFGRMSFGGGTQVREDGRFTLANVPPGDYVLQAHFVGPGSDRDGEVAAASVTVAGEDLHGVTLVASKGAAIRGRVVFDVPPAAGSVQPASIAIAGMPKDPSGEMLGFFGADMRDRLEDNWTFELRARVSPVLIRTMRVPAGYSLKSVFWRGQDVTDEGIAFKSTEAISDVEVVLTARSSTVSGVVTDGSGKPVIDYAALIFSENDAHWGFGSRRMRLARPDQRGGFMVKELPPGPYLAAAISSIEDGEESNPELLERLRSVATPFTLTDGERKAVTLKVVEY
jgi:hypothetical protein